ncbi:MAG TPA: response regulator [Burkholderiales bacterium]|nr:response regulator [Burkholderiales bacterium]
MMSNTQAAPTVFVVDDDPSILQGVARLLRASGYEAFTFESPIPLLEKEQSPAPDCIVMDVSMPELNGLQVQSAMTKAGRNASIVFMTGQSDVPTSVRAMKAGAVDFLTKPFDEETLLAAVRTAIERGRAIRTSQAARASTQAKLAALTKREREVMRGVVAGRLNKRIAVELGIAEKTVKVHRQRVMEKMQVETLADLVRSAYESDLTSA